MAYQSEIEKLEQRYHENPQQWFAALADSYRKAGNLDLAVEVVRGGLEKRPNYASGHIVLGRCLLDMKKTLEAASAFQQVLELDGENIIALKSLGEIAEQQGDIPGAKDWLSQLLEVDPMNDEARDNLERLNEIAVEQPEDAAILKEQPSIEPGAAWAAEAMADIKSSEQERSAAEGAEVLGEEATPVLHGEADPAAESATPAPEATPAGDLSIERTSWDGLHGPAGEGGATLDAGTAADVEIDAAFQEPEVVEPVPGLVDAALQEPGAVEPVSGLVGAADEIDTPAGEEEATAVSDLPIAQEEGESKMAGDLEVVSFDDELSWDAGEDRSAAISEEDVVEAAAHHEDLAPAVEFLGDPDAFATKTPEETEAEPPSSGADAALVADAFEQVESDGEPAQTGNLGRVEDLPLIMPEGDQPAASGVSADGSEIQPVVTETMADLYAKQGLFEQARETYEKLLLQRPGDAVLEQKLAEVSSQVEAASRERASRFAVADTGGQSVVAYLQQLFGSTSQQQAEAASPPEGTADLPEQDAVPQQAESALRSAFGGEPAEPPGSPTIPASDEVSLSSVFGGETPPSHPGSEPPPARQALTDEAGVSFDQFYGSGKEPPADTDGTPSDEDDESDEGADDDFRNWLEGLKT